MRNSQYIIYLGVIFIIFGSIMFPFSENRPGDPDSSYSSAGEPWGFIFIIFGIGFLIGGVINLFKYSKSDEEIARANRGYCKGCGKFFVPEWQKCPFCGEMREVSGGND